MAKTLFVFIFTIIFFGLSLSFPVFAAERAGTKPSPRVPGGLSLTPTLGGYFFSGSEPRTNTPLYGLKIGYDVIGQSLYDSLCVEGTVNYFNTASTTNDGNAAGYLFRIDGIYPFNPKEKVVPFLALGFGGIFTSNGPASENDPLLNYGAGVKYFLEDYLALRADARHLLVYSKTNTRSNFEVSLGVSYYFGKERKKKPAPPPVPKQKEKEQKEKELKEKELKEKEKAEAAGKPATAETKEAAKAPGAAAAAPAPQAQVPAKTAVTPAAPAPGTTPVGAVAPAAGQPETGPLTSKKPEAVVTAPTAPTAVAPGPAAAPTAAAAAKPAVQGGPTVPPTAPAPAPAPVPAPPGTAPAAEKPQPLPAEEEHRVRRYAGRAVVARLTVEFDANSSAVKPKYYKQLRRLAETIKASIVPSSIVVGHSDSAGRYDHNVRLSIKRAESVKKYLVKLGVDPAAISTTGYGPSRPTADNATPGGRQKNRRAVTTVSAIIFK